MTWLLDEPGRAGQVVEYEALVTELFRNLHAVGMCQYDRNRLPPDILNQALATHPTVLVAGHHTVNPFLAQGSMASLEAVSRAEVTRRIEALLPTTRRR